MRPSDARRHIARPSIIVALAVLAGVWTAADAQQLGRQPLVHKLRSANERLEMTVNSSRILDLELKIPKAQVNNQDILELTALSPNQIQIFAKKPGVTQVNLWDENDQVHSLDIIVYGDAQELAMLLETEFPTCSLKVKPTANAVILSGYVDRPDAVLRIVEMASDYYPKVINNIQVGGVQQVLLKVRVMEVSRTRLRSLGFDFASFTGDDSLVSSVSGLIGSVSAAAGTVTSTGGETVAFGVVDGSSSFFGFLEALRQNNMMKILAEPNLVAISGRSATFNVGGEFPILVPQSLGTVSIEYKKFGTQIDFVPIVLGNGRIRLEVRPRVSEVDATRSITINNTVVPGLRVRECDTGVEMQAGQTFALAGLVQTRNESETRGIPWLMDVPYAGAAFRRVQTQDNEIELLIMVTPQLVEPMDQHEVPEYGPGQLTCNPNDSQLYLKGLLEVPCCGTDENCGRCERCRRMTRGGDPFAPTPYSAYPGGGGGGYGPEVGPAMGPGTIMPNEGVPTEVVPTPADSVPGPLPEEGASFGPAIQGPAPEVSVPDSSVPDGSVPEDSAFEATVPDASIPEVSVPEATDSTTWNYQSRGRTSVRGTEVQVSDGNVRASHNRFNPNQPRLAEPRRLTRVPNAPARGYDVKK